MFYITQYNDKIVTWNITSQSIYTNSNQLKKIRLAYNWQCCVYNNEKIAKNRAKFFILVR